MAADPQPTEVKNTVTVTSQTEDSPMIIIPGVVSGAAYASGDALGIQFEVKIPRNARSGIIAKVVLMDRDKEQLQVDLELFRRPIAQVADNAAFTISDTDHMFHLGTIQITTDLFSAYNAEASATKLLVFPFGLLEGERLICQAVARGAQNLTANSDYGVMFGFLLDPAKF